MNYSPRPPIGLCLEMCPKNERQERERDGCLHYFEIMDEQKASRAYKTQRRVLADPNKTVKEYRRPAAGKELSSPYVLRPPAVLLSTVRYLLFNVWDSVTDGDPYHLSEAYLFVFDRLRAVKQDLTVQRIQGQLGAQVLEDALGFLLCAPYIVRDLPVEVYNEVLHATQVRESFSKLIRFYKENEKNPRESEFQALLLLYDLGNLDVMNRALKLCDGVKNAPKVQLAMAVNRAYLECNWVRLFRLVRRLDCMEACTFYRHLPCSRDKTLKTLVHGYSSKNCHFPLDFLTKIMAVDCIETVSEMCTRRGLFVSLNGQPSVIFFKSLFKDIGPERHGREVLLVENKKGERSWAEVMMRECEEN
ncbi:hypothetical protein GDO86_008676 [Hymenochirus boettgeri]|uniref:SAC3/GANP/THP3 conserved domain-containing protein n=1 Tax=Hymenochirus boettgeri TaxID=247094 RepID=A0A8T2J320_9PIPI|nr:hypothetical protein GDO86_008676 [Hymenochirus boettgeri]